MKIALAAVAVVCVLVAAAVWLHQTSGEGRTLIVDATEAVRVELDGVEVGTVAPGEHRSFVLTRGVHRLQVRGAHPLSYSLDATGDAACFLVRAGKLRVVAVVAAMIGGGEAPPLDVLEPVPLIELPPTVDCALDGAAAECCVACATSTSTPTHWAAAPSEARNDEPQLMPRVRCARRVWWRATAGGPTPASQDTAHAAGHLT